MSLAKPGLDIMLPILIKTCSFTVFMNLIWSSFVKQVQLGA